MRREVAIIGYGRFGRFAAHFLKKDFNVFVVEKDKNSKIEAGIENVSPEEAAGKRIIILAVPINRLPGVLKSIARFVKAGTLICDVCSVKEHPVAWMKQLLPKHVSILGTHPLFGPDSAAKGVKGKAIVLCPVRISRTKLQKVRQYLERKKIVVHATSPGKHDEVMAKTLFLTQLIGRAVYGLKLPSVPFATDNFRLLESIAATTSKDTGELFRDMYRYNRYARAVPRRLLDKIVGLSKSLSQIK